MEGSSKVLEIAIVTPAFKILHGFLISARALVHQGHQGVQLIQLGAQKGVQVLWPGVVLRGGPRSTPGSSA